MSSVASRVIIFLSTFAVLHVLLHPLCLSERYILARRETVVELTDWQVPSSLRTIKKPRMYYSVWSTIVPYPEVKHSAYFPLPGDQTLKKNINGIVLT